MSDQDENVDPGELPEDPTRTAGEAAGVDPDDVDDEGATPTEDLEDDPAYSFDKPESDFKGG